MTGQIVRTRYAGKYHFLRSIIFTKLIVKEEELVSFWLLKLKCILF